MTVNIIGILEVHKRQEHCKLFEKLGFYMQSFKSFHVVSFEMYVNKMRNKLQTDGIGKCVAQK